jgi:Hypothetical glycosyl hydrolase family 15
MKTIWFAPTGYVTGDPTLQVSHPSVAHPGTIVTSSSSGDYKWVSLGITLPPDVAIQDVIVCYELSSPASFISQVRLVEMTTPDQASVRHDDATDLKSTIPACYTSVVGGFVPATAVTLDLRLNFESARDRIVLGAVGVKIASLPELGLQGPAWLLNSETYAIGLETWDALAQSKVAFITHCPVNKGFFARCHALGIRCFPYTTFYQVRADMPYQGVNIKDHPEFIVVDPSGALHRSSFWDTEDAKNFYMACPNVDGYSDAMVAYVQQLMELGADGIFADNLSECPPCYGPQSGKHAHIYSAKHPDVEIENQKVQTHAMAMLLKRVREVIKKHEPVGAILGNSGNPRAALPPEFWSYLDADMLEAYICTWTHSDRWPDWPYWDEAGQKLQPKLKEGKQIQALSYLGHTAYGIREDAFFCYASARLAGFVWTCGWNGGLPLSNPDTAALYRIRLGKPLAPEAVSPDGVHYRVFERGMVAVNPDNKNAGTIAVGPPMPTTRLLDLYGLSTIDVSGPTKTLEVPPHSGRVYLFASGTDDQLTKPTTGKLTVATSPPLGDVEFLVDEFRYWTHRGYWKTEYDPGTTFGTFDIVFETPGKHKIELVDNPAKDLTTTVGYGRSEILGTDMDPANPIEHSGGKKYAFSQWADGLGTLQKIEVDVPKDTTVTAEFSVQYA